MASVTKQLQVGQKVSVTELETGCRLSVVPAEQTGLAVVETAPDYVVLEDTAGEVRTRIPAYLIRGVSVPTPAAPPVPAPEPVLTPVAEPVVSEAA